MISKRRKQLKEQAEAAAIKAAEMKKIEVAAQQEDNAEQAALELRRDQLEQGLAQEAQLKADKILDESNAAIKRQVCVGAFMLCLSRCLAFLFVLHFVCVSTYASLRPCLIVFVSHCGCAS